MRIEQLNLMQTNIVVADALRRRAVNWCRARLLHALAGASAQGVLEEVLHELLDDVAGIDVDALLAAIVDALVSTRWLSRSRPVPGIQ